MHAGYVRRLKLSALPAPGRLAIEPGGDMRLCARIANLMLLCSDRELLQRLKDRKRGPDLNALPIMLNQAATYSFTHIYSSVLLFTHTFTNYMYYCIPSNHGHLPKLY